MTLIFLPFEHLHNENIKLEIPLHNFILSSHTLIHPSNKENTKPISQTLFLFTLPSRPQPNLNLTSPYTSLQVFLSHNTTSRGAQRGQKWQPKPVIRNLRGTIGVSNAITLFHKRRGGRRGGGGGNPCSLHSARVGIGLCISVQADRAGKNLKLVVKPAPQMHLSVGRCSRTRSSTVSI